MKPPLPLSARPFVLATALLTLAGCSCSKKEKAQQPAPQPPPHTIEATAAPPPPQLGDAPRLPEEPPTPAEKTESKKQPK